ncbi:hypothetical protein H4S08_004853 [Coemansia sp. RSA 1365]|nr:hypothetical protein H4S08_004853 [Coemansia sp. RSA 1365]
MLLILSLCIDSGNSERYAFFCIGGGADSICVVTVAFIAVSNVDKKIRRRRQRSLFSMTTAGEYSLLDSGRISSSFDPMGLGHPFKPQDDIVRGNFDLDTREPPSLDLLAEMIKEEIRQASSLKQALDRVTAETECISQRVSNLSLSDTDAEQLHDPPMRSDSESVDVSVAQERYRKGPHKQVQFIVPDDVRFRWLGIFQQPADSDPSDEETTADNDDSADSATKHPERRITCASPVSSPTVADTHTHKTSNAPAQQENALTKPDDPATVTNAVSADDSNVDCATEHQSTNRNEQASKDGSAAAMAINTADVTGVATGSTSSTDRSEELTESDSGYLPFTASSSLEAVYGGSRSDTREQSILQTAQINAASKLLNKPVAVSHAVDKNKHISNLPSDRAGVTDGEKHVVLLQDNNSDDDPSHSRLARLLASDPTFGYADDALATISQESAASGKYQTIAGREGHRMLLLAAQSSNTRDKDRSAGDQHRKNGAAYREPHLPQVSGGSVRGSGPYPANLQPVNASSAFSQPTVATARMISPRRYAALPSFVALQSQICTDKTSAVSELPSKPDPSRTAVGVTTSSDLPASDTRRKAPPVLHRSESTHTALTPLASTSNSIRRRNSFDGSSVSSRNVGLATQALADATTASSAAESTDDASRDSEVQTAQSSHNSGLLRRVTISSSQRKHHNHHQVRLFSDDNNGSSRILGGTREFFKHRLRPRTNSSTLNLRGSTDDAADARGSSAETRRSESSTSRVQQRPRRRSDVEVKSRNTELSPPPPPAIPEQFQQRYQHINNGVPKNENRKDDAPQSLHTPRSSLGDSQTEWVAVSPPLSSASARELLLRSPQENVPAAKKRKSHDEAQRIQTHYDHYHPKNTPTTREYAKTKLQKPIVDSHLGPTVKQANVRQVDVLRRHRSTSNADKNDGAAATRTKSRRNTGESSQSASSSPSPHLPNKLLSGIGRASLERHGSSHTDESAASPPMPKLPPLPPLPTSPMSAKNSSKSDLNKVSGDTDSVDHHLRRLKDRKSRRSSFMSTISSMLGRKD